MSSSSVIRSWFSAWKLRRQVGSLDERGFLRAVEQGLLPAVEALVKRGISPDAKSGSGRPALHVAVREGNLAVVEKLLLLGASPDNGDREGNTAIMEAVLNGDKHILQCLLDRKPELNKRNQLGKTALLLAVEEGNTTFVRMLLSQQAEVDLADQQGKTPLLVAVKDAKLGMVKSLLEAGANPEQRDLSGQSAFDLPQASPRIQKLLEEAAGRGAAAAAPIPLPGADTFWQSAFQVANTWLGSERSNEMVQKGQDLIQQWREQIGWKEESPATELFQSGASVLVLLMQEIQRGIRRRGSQKQEETAAWTGLEQLVSGLAGQLPAQGPVGPSQHLHIHLPPLTKEQQSSVLQGIQQAMSLGADQVAALLQVLLRSSRQNEPPAGEGDEE